MDPATTASQQIQILCFDLAGEVYGIPILKVREIQVAAAITRIPKAPPYMPGVINLRGAIIPIIDMRVRFSLGDPPEGARPILVIVEVQDRVLGVRVDGVREVVDLDSGSIQPPPEWGMDTALDREFIKGLASLKDGDESEVMLILLDLDRLLNPDELRSLSASNQA